MAALASAQSLQPAAQGNTTGASADAFQDQIESAITTLQAAVGLAPDQQSATTVSYVVQQLQNLAQPPQFGAAMAALRGMGQ